MTDNITEILRHARNLIGTEKRWSRYEYARTSTGTPCDPLSPEATCWCSLGALAKTMGFHVAGGRLVRPTGEAVYDVVIKALSRGIPPEYDHEVIWSYQDLDTTTHADVLAMWDRAIAASSAEVA